MKIEEVILRRQEGPGSPLGADEYIVPPGERGQTGYVSGCAQISRRERTMMGGGRSAASLHCVSRPPHLRFHQQCWYNSRMTPHSTRCCTSSGYIIHRLTSFFYVSLLFFSKKVNFMVDLCSKYVCISAVALVETHSFGDPFHSFSIFWWHRVT